MVVVLFYRPVPLALLAEPRLQADGREYVCIHHPPLVVGLVGMLAHHRPIRALERAPSACQAVHHGHDGLRGRAVGGQAHSRRVVRRGEALDVLPHLTPDVYAHLMPVVQVSSHGGRLERVAAVVAAADQDAVGRVQGNEVTPGLGNRPGPGPCSQRLWHACLLACLIGAVVGQLMILD